MFAMEEKKKVQRKVMQKATTITHTSKLFTYKPDGINKTTVEVGKKMVACLDHNDKQPGSGTSGFTGHDGLMTRLDNKYSIYKVRGHLLNAKLGGLAIKKNLFPITGSANSTHSQHVEKIIKDHYQSDQANGVGKSCKYTVEVVSGFDEDNPNATFKCKCYDNLDGSGGKIVKEDIQSIMK